MKKFTLSLLLSLCLAFPTVAIAGPKDPEVCGVQIKVFNEENRIVAGYWGFSPVSDQMAGDSWMREVLFYLSPGQVLSLYQWPSRTPKAVVINADVCSGEVVLDWNNLALDGSPDFILLGDPLFLWST